MKNFLFSFLVFLSISNCSFAQGEQGKVTEVGGIMLLRPASSSIKGGGFGLNLGVLYGLSDKLSVGAVGEGAISLFSAKDQAEGASFNIWYGGKAVAEYYFTTAKIKPIVGFGIGALNSGSVVAEANDGDAASKWRLAMGPRLGVLLGNFRISAEYCIIPSKIKTTSNTYNLSYIGINIGAHIGSNWD